MAKKIRDHRKAFLNFGINRIFTVHAFGGSYDDAPRAWRSSDDPRRDAKSREFNPTGENQLSAAIKSTCLATGLPSLRVDRRQINCNA
jgi:hypothetical protein